MIIFFIVLFILANITGYRYAKYRVNKHTERALNKTV